MKIKNNQNHLKETRQENLLTLKRAIDSNSMDEITEFSGEWVGSYVVITSSPENVYNPKTDEDDWYGRRSECTYVLTKHSESLSKFFAYVGENIMKRRGNYLYGFMALLANDYINRFGDNCKSNLLLEYVFSEYHFILDILIGIPEWEMQKKYLS